MSKEILRPSCLKPIPNTFCPGCLHSMANKLVGQCIDELGLAKKTVVVMPVGCSTMGLRFWNMDMVSCAHGRAPAVATGLKRTQPETFVFTYQGDGDLASIGMAEIVHAATRGENITVIFINNAIYGMTGGQMAPTTLVGQKATTCIYGRDPKINGNPINVCELLSSVTGPAYLERVMVTDVANVMKAKKAIKKAFEYQMQKKGFTLIEVLCTCPTNWGLSPVDAMTFVKEKMQAKYPLGVYKDIEKETK